MVIGGVIAFCILLLILAFLLPRLSRHPERGGQKVVGTGARGARNARTRIRMQNAMTPPMIMLGSYPAPRNASQATIAASGSISEAGATSSPPAAGGAGSSTRTARPARRHSSSPAARSQAFSPRS